MATSAGRREWRVVWRACRPLPLSLPGRGTPVIATRICSVLALSDIFLGPTFPNTPLWIGITNRLLCLTAIWGPVAYFLQYRKNEEALRKAHSAPEAGWRMYA